jgi:NAD-dependent dihydropyrimidine dehydrogenase PreA subunit
MHAKWQGCSGVGYKYLPVIEVDGKKCNGDGMCVEKCPAHILKIDKKKVVVEDSKKCMLCDSCVEECTEGAIKVHGEPTKFIFSFETDGAVPALRALQYALKFVEDEFTEFREKLGEELE